jgi:hypothetical protein
VLSRAARTLTGGSAACEGRACRGFALCVPAQAPSRARRSPLRWVIGYREAAAQGWAVAQANLGFMCVSGRGGLAQHDAQTVSLLRSAADQGDALGENNLAFMYMNGRGRPAQSETAAVRGYTQVARQGIAGGAGIPEGKEPARVALRARRVCQLQVMLWQIGDSHTKGVPNGLPGPVWKICCSLETQ